MTDDTQRLWLVERDYNDKGLVTLVYATLDGEQCHHRNRSAQMLKRTGVTAAADIDTDSLQPVDEPALRDRYAHEATRMKDQHDPDDRV